MNDLGVTENALLRMKVPIPFEDLHSDRIEPAIQNLLDLAKAEIEAIERQPYPDFDSVLLRLDRATEPLEYAMSLVRHLEAVLTNSDWRAAYNRVQGPVAELYASIPLNGSLWQKIRDYSATENATRLHGVQARFLKLTVESFLRNGAALDQKAKSRMAEIDVELTRLTTRFSENVLDSTNEFDVSVTNESELAGLPPLSLAAARSSATAKDQAGYRFTLQAPSYLAVLTYADNARLREQLYLAYGTRATSGVHDNRDLIPQILALRREKAELLGFADFGDLILDDRMAQRGQAAADFLADLESRTRPHFDRENGDLQTFRQQLEGPDAQPLQPWDVAYYAEKLRQKLYEFNEEELRPYFSLERVVDGMFALARQLFQVEIVARPEVRGWHDDVRYYEIVDGERVLAGFYSDWFPRESKRGGAWMDVLITSPGAHDLPHIGVICGNLTPPVDGRPALLTHREVETIFHEFGHLLHHALSQVPLRTLAGTNVAWDFVELPSQIMENWCWERLALDLFARHYETGESIPEPLLDRMRRARTYRAANGQMRQLGFGILDLELHRTYRPERDGDAVEYSRRILQRFSPAEVPEGHAMLASFTHILGSPVGYAAGYYSYKWAEVLDADAFQMFKQRGVLDPAVGMAFRNEILAKGNADEPAALFRRFRGRDPQPEPLLHRLGLLERN